MKIYSQAECNYRHIQDALAMLPASTRELDPSAQPETLRALSVITSAVTGANPTMYFAVAEMDGVTVGFIAGAHANYMLESRSLAQDILLYVAPEHRGSGAATALVQAFSDWGTARSATEIRLVVMNSGNSDALLTVTEKLGFQKTGTVMTLRKESV